MLQVITVCGLGVGSSLILKMTCESAFRQLNMKVNIEHWDMGTVKGKKCDLLITTESFRKNFQDLDNVVYVQNMVDVAEMKRNLAKYFSDKGLK